MVIAIDLRVAGVRRNLTARNRSPWAERGLATALVQLGSLTVLGGWAPNSQRKGKAVEQKIVTRSPWRAVAATIVAALPLVLASSAQAAKPKLSIADLTLVEHSARAKPALSLSKKAPQRITIKYTTQSGTAAGAHEDDVGHRWHADFQTVTRETRIARGEKTGLAKVTLIDDSLDEPEESFTVKILRAKGAKIVDGEATVTLLDDDRPPPRGRAF